MKQCDVIIPVYNNAPVLPVTLHALFTQEQLPGWEYHLFVCDDGSTDGSLAALSDQPPGWTIHIIRGSHTGSAGARNRGITESRGDIVFLLGADIVLRPGALLAHCQFHEVQPQLRAMALGMVRWDPRIQPSPLMEWMMHGGTQNDFDAVLGHPTVSPAHYFYGSHVSLKRAFLGQDRFSEDFKGYGWEDLELGRRLENKGGFLVGIPQAVGLHHHWYTPQAVAQRQEAMGRALVIYQQHYPQEQLIPSQTWLHRLLRRGYILGGGPWISLQLMRISQYCNIATPRLFSWVIRGYFWKGIEKVSIVFLTNG